jgi:hypothetical protein
VVPEYAIKANTAMTEEAKQILFGQSSQTVK